MIPFLDVGGLNSQLEDQLSAASSRVISSGIYILGPELESFEHELAHSQGSKFAIGVGNGLDALTLALMALGVGPGDEIIVPSHTFIATWLSVTRIGATVVPVDIDPRSYNIDVEQTAAAITPRTAGIVPVHLYGAPADMEGINTLAAKCGIPVVADGAQSIGARLQNQPIGSFAAATTLSFYPGKNLGALGDGGAVLTDDSEIASRVKALRNYGSTEKYVHDKLGMNSRLDELQAALLRAKLPYLNEWNARRSEIASRYSHLLTDVELELPWILPDSDSSWHLYVVKTKNRKKVQAELMKNQIQTLIHYPTPPSRQKAYLSQDLGPCPVAEHICQEILSLPMCPTLSDTQVEKVAEVLSSVLNEQPSDSYYD